jgi:hypothetical protein
MAIRSSNPRCPIARISQYETSKPLCDRLVYASGSARSSVEAEIGGPPTRGGLPSGASGLAIIPRGLALIAAVWVLCVVWWSLHWLAEEEASCVTRMS